MNKNLSSNDRIIQIEAMYQMNSSADLKLMQSGAITYTDWARRQQEHCQRYYTDRAKTVSA